MSFQFVNQAQIDKTTRRSIRSHVMKGKNAGRTVHRPSKLDAARRPLRMPRQDEIDDAQRCTALDLTAPPRNLADPFLSISYPGKLSPRGLRVINIFFGYIGERFYPCRFGFPLEGAKALWLDSLISDEASYHCSMALMEACNEFFLNEGVNSKEGLYHLSRTFALVNQRMKSEERASDSTLGIVTMLILQEQIRKGQLETQIHFDGLKRMVELRGGLRHLENNPLLVLKICKIDIINALVSGGPTTFFRDRMADVYVLQSLREQKDACLSVASINNQLELNPYLREVLVDVLSLTSWLTSAPHTSALEYVVFQEIVMSVCYRLIRFHPLGTSQSDSATHAIYHIGLIVFMMSLFLQYDERRITQYDLVSSRLQEVIQTCLHDQDHATLLWFLLIAGVWMSGDGDGSWEGSELRKYASRMPCGTWNDAQLILRGFPWVPALHDGLGYRVWVKAFGS